ncbi:hypothetical protein MATL_G00021900 [Megalops atlanticus]|uniref:Reverse transcriptase domain-containing protein n=1 Tax=Megalops atlanticus TaxID=7932 RepID=A0A9D3QCN8_MEGAT|nr:hypothetical protein MATL_G00021900 [Megalops atlanticus]
MISIASRFYSDLFADKPVSFETGEVFLGKLEKRISDESRSRLEQPISRKELDAALADMAKGKVPGADGLPMEFYRTFWDVLGPVMVDLANEVFSSGLLGDSMRTGVLSLLFKKGDVAQLKNWRPLTMLCVDYKLLTKVITERLKVVIAEVVHIDQTCGVPGRSIMWNLQLIRDSIAWVEDRSLHLMLVSLDQEKAFDRVNHGFLFRVLERMGFGPSFISWVKLFYRDVGSRVLINGVLGDLIPQAAGVRQGCPLSPLLYVLYMEPFAAAVRADPYVDGLHIPGSSGSVVKIAQYADDTTLFLTSDLALQRALDLIGSFGRAAGTVLNRGPLQVLGVSFLSEGAAHLNWRERLGAASRKLALWKARSLSFKGKVLALKVGVLPSLLYLAQVYPMPASMRKGLVRSVFDLVWGGKYEYIARRVMYMDVREGGRDVPNLPLKLDCLFFSNLCQGLVSPVLHPFHHFRRLWFSFPMRRLVTDWSNAGPKAEQLPWHYRMAVRFIARIPPQTSNAALLKHRTLYAEMRTEPGTRAVVGIDNEVWERVQPKALDHRLQDLNWLCVHSRLPVRDVLYRHKLTRHPFCPHPTCMGEETLSHAFWDCGFAKEVWTRTERLLRALDSGFVLDYDKLIRGWDARRGKKDTDFLLLLVISLTKKKIWDCRELLVKKNVTPSAAGVCNKVFFDLKFRVRKDVVQWGYHSAREKWKGLFTLLQ